MGSAMRQHGSVMIRFLHTRIRVRDLDRSIAFYTTLGQVCQQLRMAQFF